MMDVDRGGAAFWIVFAAGALSGALSLWMFRRFLDAARFRAAANRMLAHLFEFQLFSDEPALILRAQRDLLAANGRLLKLIALPLALLTLPMAILLVGVDAVFSRAPLAPGQATVVTVQCKTNQCATPGNALSGISLSAPAGVNVETPAVHIVRNGQISWRVRPVQAISGDFEIRSAGGVIQKSIVASPGLRWISERRAGSIGRFLLHPAEGHFSSPVVDWVEVAYPPATVFGKHWLVWFVLGSLAGASFLLLPLRFRE
ncbi:MAG TPA: hypothetical protein VHD76_01515 [Bryobacteraceae bacterium]|jgi:hypothetical protein|nr:hypothetical protein [Bryobacteraceae bacterium]